MSRNDALELAQDKFPEIVKEPQWQPPKLRSGQRISRYLGTHGAVIENSKGKELGVLQAVTPFRVTERGRNLPVDLRLQEQGSGYVSRRALADTELPKRLRDGLRFNKSGFGIRLADARDDATSTVTDDRLFFAAVDTDTDVLVAPLPTGAEFFAQLRSARSPETQRFELDLPKGAMVRLSNDGAGAEIVRGSRVLGRVSAPRAWDAEKRPVPSSLRLERGDLLVETKHQRGDFSYPIMVDPEVTEDEYWWSDPNENFAGWANGWNSGGFYFPQSDVLGRGMYIKSGDGRQYSSGAFGEWYWQAPRSSFIASVDFWPLTYMGDGSTQSQSCTSAGIWNPQESKWETDNPSDPDPYDQVCYGSISEEDDKDSLHWCVIGGTDTCAGVAGHEGNMAVLAQSYPFSEQPTRVQWTFAEGAALLISDRNDPTISVHGTNSWVDAPTLNILGHDDGVGVADLALREQGRPENVVVDHSETSCPSGHVTDCPTDHTFAFDTSKLPTGRNHLVAAVEDYVGRKATQNFDLKVDHDKPQVQVTGSLYDARGTGVSGGTYELRVAATDGTAEVAESGVKSVEVKVTKPNGQAAPGVSAGQGCADANCKLSQSLTFNPLESDLGQYTFKVIVKDQLDHEWSREWKVEVVSGDLLQPGPGARTSKRLKFEAKADRPGLTHVAFEWRRSDNESWRAVPVDTLQWADNGNPLGSGDLPIQLEDGGSRPVVWDLSQTPGLGGVDGPVQVRGSFSGAVGATTEAAHVSFDQRLLGGDFGRAQVGPGEVQLLSGNFSLDRTDVSLAGGDSDMTVSRTYNSRDLSSGQTSPFGPGWTLATPVMSAASDYVRLTKDPSGFAVLTLSSGEKVSFEKTATGYRSPSAYSDLTLRDTGPDTNVNQMQLESIEGRSVRMVRFDPYSPYFYPHEVKQPDGGITRIDYETALDTTPVITDKFSRTVSGGWGDLKLGGGTPADGKWTVTTGAASQFTVGGGKGVVNVLNGQRYQALLEPKAPRDYDVTTTVTLPSAPAAGQVTATVVLRANTLGGVEKFYRVGVMRDSLNRILLQGTHPGDSSGNYLWTTVDTGLGGPTAGAGGRYRLRAQVEGGDAATIRAKVWKDGSPEPASWAALRNNAPPIPASGSLGFRAYQDSGQASAAIEFDDLLVYPMAHRPKSVVPPVPTGTNTDCLGSPPPRWCRKLTLSYASTKTATGANPSQWGDYPGRVTGLDAMAWDATDNQMKTFGVARYSYDDAGRLRAAWDPRISPALKETYAYDADGLLSELKPPGELPWTMKYTSDSEQGGVTVGKALYQVERAKPVGGIATTTVAYGVPTGGAGAPYAMGADDVGSWGQADVPTDATAIFPADQVPADPPTNYSHATLYYLNGNGRTVNVVGPGGATVTSEYDRHGNVIRELSAENRARALDADDSEERAEELDTDRVFSSDGLELLDEYGPLHEVRLPGEGDPVQARGHTRTEYDQEAPFEGGPYHLPTTVTKSAYVPDRGEDADLRVMKTEYGGQDNLGWKLRKPTATIQDARNGGKQLRTVIKYDAATGLEVERRAPAAPASQDTAQVTKTYYWTHGNNPANASCSNRPEWAGLLCRVSPGGQPTTSAPPLHTKRVDAYNMLNQPIVVVESNGVHGRSVQTKYDAAGRVTVAEYLATNIGTMLPQVEYNYDSNTGRLVETKTIDGSTTQRITRQYDTLGRPTSYTDADGNVSTVSYDLLGRVATTTDGKGSQTRQYDPITGDLVAVSDSQAGEFTGTYDHDGQLLTQRYPTGFEQRFSYNEEGEATHLVYQKLAGCAENCELLRFHDTSSIHGDVVDEDSTLGHRNYTYDGAGRLTQALDTPNGEGCTTRRYGFDKNSNRTTMTTNTPAADGSCDTASNGTVVEHSYDEANRLADAGYEYDHLGRITAVPARDAGGSELRTSFYANDRVRSMTQDGKTHTFSLDPLRRVRAEDVTGEVSEIMHYAADTDNPAWTEKGSAWQRQIQGVDGSLVCVQDSSDGKIMQLSNLHGDIVATMDEGGHLETFRTDEFGVPQGSPSDRYGWLGSKGRQTNLASGAIQMGVREYVPQIGRFLQTDPVFGGSANAYDYAAQDPVNNLDLDGQRCARLHARPWSFRATIYLCRQGTRELQKILRDPDTIGFEAGLASLCGSLASAGAPGVLAAAGCAWYLGKYVADLVYNTDAAVRENECFTLKVFPSVKAPAGLGHEFGHSAHKKYCKTN